MKTYVVVIREELRRDVKIEAWSKEEAEEKAREQYNNQEIVLDDTDYTGVEYQVI